ncbi:MAG: hypothetical protein WDZ91_11400 [Paenibacillaceae bacterium]
MKRYGLSIVFVVLIVISIGTFYTQATTSHYSNFKLITQHGDESEIEGVLLKGNYVNDLNYRINPAVTVDSAGSKYMNKGSLLFMDPFYWESEEVKQLVSEHRQFMRGKRGVNGLYEDDQLLVYAEAKSDDPFSSGVRRFYFEVSVLDKKQNKSWSYEVNVPNGELGYMMINVQDVQVFGDEIVVVTSNFLNTVGKEYHRYSLDLGSNRAPLDQVIILPQPENVVIEGSGTVVNVNVQSVYETDITEPSNYNVFYSIQTQALVEDADTYTAPELGVNAIQMAQKLTAQTTLHEIVGAQIVVYDLQTGLEVKSDTQLLVDFITTQSKRDFMNLTMEGDNLFLIKQSEQGVTVMEYNISDAKATIHDIKLDNQTDAETLKMIKQQRMYILTKDDSKQPSLVIVDLNSDETIYQGTIELNETVRYQANELNKLHFNNMDIK